MDNTSQPLYTYRCGEKIMLERRTDQFVVRSLPKRLPERLQPNAEQMSSMSTRVTVNPDELHNEMEEARKMGPTQFAYQQAGTDEEFLMTDRIIVTFHHAISIEDLGKFAGEHGFEILHQFSDSSFLFRLMGEDANNPVGKLVELMETENEVANVEHDLNYRAVKYINLPRDTSYLQQWHLHTRNSSSEFDPRSSSNCEAAWQFLDSFGDSEVVIGFSDDGCQLDHPDFDSGSKFGGWAYFQGLNLRKMGDPGARPENMYQDGSDHGTSVAGVIGAENDGIMTVGAAPGCKIIPIKWESEGPSLFISDTKLLIALEYIADKVDVFSNSWGVVPIARFSQNVIDKINTLSRSGGRRNKGIVFLWAAGNENCPIEHSSNQDIPYTSGWQFFNGAWNWVGVRTSRTFENNLSSLPGVLHIGALASTAQRSHYSNYGTNVELCAPSSNSHAYFRLNLKGLGIVTATGFGNQITDQFGGTSSATPLVAGIIGLALTANPNLSATEIIALLKETASKDLNMTPYPKTPSARFDPDPGWDVSPVSPFDSGEFQEVGSPHGSWSPWFGFGKVDALALVQNARGSDEVKLSFVKDANAPIPDADLSGILSRLNVDKTGMVQNLRVQLEIRHTYIGDLTVALSGPQGDKVILHNREGKSQDDIRKKYDLSSTPGLRVFQGKEMGGVWTLEVVDHAPQDRGTLLKWGLEFDSHQDTAISVSSMPGIKIPDRNTEGVRDTLFVSESRTIQNVEVDLDITHPWVGDLKIELKCPDGVVVTLHDRSGGSSDDIRRKFTSSEAPALSQLKGKASMGNWELYVADFQFRDTGKLNKWTLKII